eukprot:333703-Rhodomonas_salina.2
MLAIMSPRFQVESLSPRSNSCPFSPVEQAFDSFDFPFGRGSFGGGAGMMRPPTAFPLYAGGHFVARPRLEVKDGSYIIRVETPGVKQEHLQVELLGRRSLL